MQVTLDWLQTTFATFCDGDWEHYYGITIETLDNPGWRVTIDLVDTDLAPHAFPPVDYAASEQDWVHCRVREGRFEGFGGPYNLTDILRLFRTWVDTIRAGEPRRLMPVLSATGAHSTFERDPCTGRVTHYAEWRPQPNPQNPDSWERVKEYHGTGKSHYNKKLNQDIPTPHVWDPYTLGEVRPPTSDETPQT
jgi:hypothetical protein